MQSMGIGDGGSSLAGARGRDPCHHLGMAGGERQEGSNELEPEAEHVAEHESAYSLLRRGHELMRRGHHAQAAIVLERASMAEPGKGSILEALGRAYYNSGQHERSRDAFESLLDVDPSAHYAHFALGQSFKQLGRRREARTHLKLAVALSPSSRLYQQALERLGPAAEKPAPAAEEHGKKDKQD
jgi:tetratricopeptide (TPR) repeat protein